MIFGGVTPEQFLEKIDMLAGMKGRIATVTKERKDTLDNIRESVATAGKKPSCAERLNAALNKTADKLRKKETIEKEIKERHEEIKDLKRDIASLEDDLENGGSLGLEDRIKDAERDIDTVEEEIEELEKELKKYGKAEASKVNAGLNAALNKKIVAKKGKLYKDKYTDREYVGLTWGEVKEILGHEHEATAEDDKILLDYLISEGYPKWIKDAEGFTDEKGWYIEKPKEK